MALSMDQQTPCHLTNVVEQEQIQKRTFTNWINAQLAKRSPPSRVSDLFSDLRDGAVLLDLLEVITGQPMERQQIHGVFQQRVDLETALGFLKERSVKLVNINIPDIIDGKPAIILGLIWTIILHCHIEEIATSLSSSLLLSPLNGVESGVRTHPSLHKSFGQSAKKVLLTWAQDQCHRAGCSVTVKDLTSSWRSGEAFLAILSSLRPGMVDLTQVRTRTNLENLERAFELAERELHIPRLLEPQDVDVLDPDEKSIMTFIAQFLKFSIKLSSPDANMQFSIVATAAFKDDIQHKTTQQSLTEGSHKGPTEAQKAKSRMEKCRVQLQTRIGQAIKLFSNKDITEAEVKRKEKGLKALRPALLEDFLSAVDSFGALCSEPQLQELTLLSDSVRKQWEDVRMEMSTHIDMLWSKIRERKQQQVSVLARTGIDQGAGQQKQEEVSVRSRQDRGWGRITANLQPKSEPMSQEVKQSVKCGTEATDQMESADNDTVWVSESINKTVSLPVNISAAVERWQAQEDKRANLVEEKPDVCPQNQPHDFQFSAGVKDIKILENEDVFETGEGKIRKRTREVKHGQSLHQRRTVLLGKLMELRTSAEELDLQEPTLPALHQRSRALMRLESCLSGLHSELEHIRKSSQSERCDVNVNQELEALWGETTKAVSERLEQCGLLAELLKRFQKIRGEVGETLQRAESAVKEQASYMGRDNLHRLHTKVDEAKSELNNLGDRVGELRSVSRQLHGHLQQVPGCSSNIPFEAEAHSLMDQWLDISERVESHFENLHFALSLWDGALKLGREAEHWAINKLSTFARSPTFHTEEDMEALQDEVRAQEESAKCFGRISVEIQGLLQTTEPPPELQVGEAQMRKKLSELKELISEAEDVFRQTEAAKANVTERMNDCSCTLHTIHQALLCLSGSHPATVLPKLTDLYQQLQVQDEQVQALREDLQLLASVGRPNSMETLCTNLHKLQERLTEVHQLFSEVEGRTQRDIQLYDRQQTEVEKQWQNNAEVTLDPSVVHKEVLQKRGWTEALSQQLVLIEESGKLQEQQNNFETSTSGGVRELSESLSTQSCVKAVETPDARVSNICRIQRGQCTRSAAEDSRTCAGGSVDGLKGEIQEMQEEVDPWSNQPRHDDLQMSNVPNLINNMRENCIPRDSPWSELETCLELLKARLDEEPITEKAVCDVECLGRLLQDGCHRLTSLQRNMSDFWREITATPGSAPGPEVLQQLAALEKDLSQHAALRDPDSSIAQQINNFLNHKRALDVSIRERMSQEQQMGKHIADTVSNNDRPISKPTQSVCAEDTVKESGMTQDKTLTLQQLGPMEQSSASNQRSSGSGEFIPLYKEYNPSHGQPLHPPQNGMKIEIQESFSSGAKHISTVPEKGPNGELQETITNTIVQDSKREQNEEWTAERVEIHTGGHTSVEDGTARNFTQDDTNFSKIKVPNVGSNLRFTMESANQNDKKVSQTADRTDNGNINHLNDTGTVREEKHYLDSIGGLLKELCKLEIPGSSEVTDATPEQITSDMDTERADSAGEYSEPGEGTGGACKHKFTMRDVLAGVQSLVENSCIINRAPRFDLSCLLKSSSGEAEVQLMRTIHRVLACRYQAAQLSPKSMMRQLQEAEGLRCCVQEQVTAIRNGESDVPKSVEALCNAALLEASATVQIKEAILEQVKKYHRQLRMAKAFLEVVATEKEKMSLDCLGSCERQAEQLGALLKTMDHKRSLIDECAKLSGQLSVHLSHTERFSVLVAHFGDAQEEWRILEQSIKTARQQASNSAFQIFAFRGEIKQLKDRLEELLFSSFVTLPNFQNPMHLLTWTADLKMYSQKYDNLRSQFDGIAHCCIGQNDKGGLTNDLDELESLLNEIQMKLRVFSGNCGNIYSTDDNRQLQDLFLWAKQAESNIVIGEKLALFPEEARIQIAELERLQTDLLHRRDQIEEMQFEERETASKEGCDQALHALLELYQRISNSSYPCLATVRDNLKDREILFAQLASIDEWLAGIRIKTDYFRHIENVQQDDIPSLEKECNVHKEEALEIEGKLKMLDAVAESCEKILVGLGPGESRYLVNRLAGVKTEIGGVLAHEKAVVLELEELIHQWSKCNEDLSNIETDLEQICLALNKQRFPLMQESIAEIVVLKCKLVQHQCQVQGLEGYQEVKRSSILDAIGELLDKCNGLCLSAVEQDKYKQLRGQMELSRDKINEDILGAKDKETSLGERFRLCQSLLVELPLVKTQCQEVADQLEAIAQELYPTELNAERQRIRQTVQTLVTLEHTVTEDIKHLESKLMLGLRFEAELPATMELMRQTEQELEEAMPVDPDEKAVDVRLQKHWVLWRNMESGMRVLEGLARKRKKSLSDHEELYATRNAVMKKCLVQMESLSQARESLKDYQWAAQGATGFLRNAEATFLSSCRGFADCAEEQRQTLQALDALGAGFQAHVDHLTKVIPKQLCLSHTKMEKVHTEMLSQLLVGRAMLEAQTQLRVEALQRCLERLQKHKSHHEGVLRTMCEIEDNLSKCAAQRIDSFEQCTVQHKKTKLLTEDLQVLAGQIEELRAACPMQGCGSGRGGEVSALWRRWAVLRRSVGLLTAHTEQNAEEWKDITTSIEECCTSLASLQTELPPCSPGAASEEGSMTLRARAELHQARLETQERALASLERRLEHALSRAHSHGPTSPGPVGKTLLKIKDDVRSLKERNQQAVEAAQVKETEQRRVMEELAELESHVLCLSSTLESCSGQPQQQETKEELSSLQSKLQHIVDSLHSFYSEIPLDICTHLQDIQLSLQRLEERMTERSAHVEMLAGRVEELRSGLERVNELLKQRSQSVTEAQRALKHVWDELDLWHGRLMLLESEVQDLAEDLPDQAHLLMDQLTEPLQCYQNTAQRVEQHTAFLSKIPACLRQFQDILYRATCWLDEAESWLGASCSFTTAKSLQNHANSLQLLLEDSERIRLLLQEFRPVLCDVSAVCDINVQENRLEETDRHVLTMQQTILQPLGSLLQAAMVVEKLEAELKTIERNVSKIEAILSEEGDDSFSINEHLQNKQVILSSAQSAKEVLQDMQRVKEELELPPDTKDKLLVFCKATSLMQRIEELEQLSHKQASVLEDDIKEKDGCPMSKSPADGKQDPYEAIRAADQQKMDKEKQLANVQVIDCLPCEQDSLETTESWLLSVRPWLDTSVSENIDSDLEPGDLQNFEMTRRLISTDVSSVENQTSVVEDKNQRQEVLVSSSSRTKAGLEDTRLVPVRPITPFAVAAALQEEEDEHPSLSASLTEVLDTSNEVTKWNDIVKEEKYGETNDSSKLVAQYLHEETEPLWTHLPEQICQKLSSLDKLQPHFQNSKGETLSNGAIVHQTQQAVLALKSIMSSSVSGEQGDLLETLKQVLFSLDALTGFLLTSVKSGNSNPELKQLQNECVRGELVTLSELLNGVEVGENMAVSQCVTSLQQCVSAVDEQLQSHMDLTQQQQETSNHMFLLDCLGVKHNSLFQSSEELPVMQCVLVRHLRRSPGAGAGLRQASQSLLQGMSGLVELGEECTAEGQTRALRSQSELQRALQRLEKLQRVLASQSAFADYLFQRETLKCHEDEWAQLLVRVRALRQQALDQRVSSHINLQEWTQWEDNCGQLGWLLDESEAFLSAEEQQGSQGEELRIQQRIQECQRLLSKLDESRATLGLLLEQGQNLQVTSVRQRGGALELRWKNVYRQVEQNIKRCRDMQENWASIQTDMASLSQWLTGAQEQLQTYSDLTATSDLKPDRVPDSLIELLDFCTKVGVMSVQKESICRNASPGLKVRITSLESQWGQLTSALSQTQEQLQQHLLKRWSTDDLLSALEDWLKKKQALLNKEKEETVKATSSTYLSKCLQSLKGLLTGLQHGQLLLDFLCQSEPPLVGEDAIIHRSERTMLAENLGALRLRWTGLQGELENQINEALHRHHIWPLRQKKLQHLQSLIDQTRTKLDQWKRPHSEFLARRLLLEWEGHLESLKDMAANVEELKDSDSNAGNEIQKYTGDKVFAEQVEVLGQAFVDIIQQAETAKPSLLQTLEKWTCFKKLLNEISLYSARLHCSLQQLQVPSLSLQQAERHLHDLQELHLTTDFSEDKWDSLDKSYKNLVKNIDPAAAHVLNDQMQREQKRWKAVLQDLTDATRKAQENVSAWQEFTDQTNGSALQIQTLWSQWEELVQSPRPYQHAETQLQAAEDLQEKAESVKNSLEHLLKASKLLTGRLDPMASNIVSSQTSQLSCDVTIFNQTLQRLKLSIQDDNELLKNFKVNLEKLETQTKEIEAQMNGVSDVDCAKQVFWELACLFSSVFDVSEMSAHVNLSNQEAQRLHTLKGRYMESLSRGLDLYKQLHFQHHHSLDFEGKCKALIDIQDTLEQETTSRHLQSYTGLKQVAAIHQKLQGDIAIGHKLLHELQCDAVMVMENTSPEQRSESLARVSCLRHKWIDLLNVIDWSQSLVKQRLSQFATYRYGWKHLNNVLKDIDALLPPTSPTICVSPLKIRDYEDTEKALQAHAAIYTRTVAAGRTVCESMTDVQCQMQLKTEIHALEEAWERATSELQRQKALINNTVQKWGQCQQKIAEVRSELDECGLKLKQAVSATSKDTKEVVQETEFSLQRLRTEGLHGADTMKMDLSPYVPAGDSALLEKQLEQLHSQWEDLCLKVSSRKQEIADRLNAWTIFNDKNKEFCDWLTQMENKVCHSADLSFEEMVEKLKKDCMEEINLFSENKRHLKQLGEQLLWASDEAKQSQVHGSLQEANQRWHCLFHHIEARVKKLKETLAAVQQLDKNMSNLRSWLCRIEAELSRPITYSVLHHQEIQKRLAEHQELQRDIEQHTEGVASVLNLCDVLLQDEDASNGTGADGDSLQETSRSLDQRWRTICAMALDRRLRIEETWRLWCKFLDDYSRFEDWLKMAERTAANPNSGDVPYTVAKEELKKFEGFQRQVNERLTQLEIVNNQYRRLARENRTDRASQLKAMVHEGNRRWDALHRRVGAVLRRLKYFTNQREDFESTRESMLVWLTELDLQLTNVEHFSESDVHHKIQQLNSFQKEITLNTERIDGLIVFGEGLIQRSSPQDAALIEEELEELHSYCQEVFGRLVRFHHRLSQPPIPAEPESPITSFSLESSLALIGRPWLGRSLSSPLATPTHLLATPLSRSGRDTPVSVDSLPLEWDHTGDVGGSSSHEDEDDDDLDDEGAYFSAVSSRSVCDSPRWRTQEELAELESDGYVEALPTLASTPLKQGNYLHLMSQCSDSIEDFKRVSLILDDEEPDEFGLSGTNLSRRQSGVIERWELAQAQSQTDLRDDPQEQLPWTLDQISSWLHTVIPQLQTVLMSDPPSTVEDMSARARELKEMHKMFTQHKSTMLQLNLNLHGDPELASVNQRWSTACTDLQHWDTTLRKTLLRCQEFHETLHSLLLWLAHAESRRYAVDIHRPETTLKALKQHRNTLTDVREELVRRQSQQASLHALWSQLQPEHSEDSEEAQEKLHVIGSKMRILLREVTEDLKAIQQRLEKEPTSDEQDQRVSTVPSEGVLQSMKKSSNSREGRETAQPRSFFLRLLRAAFPLHLLLLLLLLLPCLVPMSPPEQSCTVANNFARSFYPMLRYTNGPPPT